MTDEEAKRILESIANDIDNKYPVTDAWYANALREIALLIVAKQDEIDSVWQVLEEMRLSDISNHTDKLISEVDKHVKSRRKIAKVSEA